MESIVNLIEKEIHNNLSHHIRTIHVTWKRSNFDTRITFGSITRQDNMFFFELSNMFHKYRNERGDISWDLLIKKLYESPIQEVLIFDLLKRIPTRRRRDGIEMLEFWAADKESYDDFDKLGLTQGRMIHDDFEFLAEFPAEEGMTFVTNLSYVDKIIASEVPNIEQLFFNPEPENPHDPNAIAVYIDKQNKQKVGYIKSYHNLFFHECLKKGIQPKLIVQELQIFNTIQSQVYIKVTA